jgi:3-phytase
VLFLGHALAGCAAVERESVSDSRKLLIGVGTPVFAVGETEPVATQKSDAADDPAIWVDARDPNRVVIFGTDKQAGLYSYGLDGKVKQFIPDGRLNNVDLRDGFPTPSGPRVLVAASDRDRIAAALYLLNPATLETARWGLVKIDLEEPYGLCMGRRGDHFIVIVNGKDGHVRQIGIAAGPDGSPNSQEEKRFAVGSQTEGCVVDDVKDVLYIGEEAKGIWRYSLDPAVSTRTLVAGAPSAMLKPDVEGLALIREGPKTWLIASSQGDSAFAVWQVDGDAPRFAGRFSVMAGGGIDGVTGTDGLDAHDGPVGPHARGLLVIQDDVDSEGETHSSNRNQQNFKLVPWAAVVEALDLDEQPPSLEPATN